MKIEFVKKQRKQTVRRQSSENAERRPAPPALELRRAARWPYLHDFKLYISEIPICRAPTPRYEMKQNKSGTTRCARKKSKSKLKIKGFFQRGRRAQCLRPSSDAGHNKNMRLALTYKYMEWDWLELNMCGWVVGIEGEFTAKTVIGLPGAGERRTAHN